MMKLNTLLFLVVLMTSCNGQTAPQSNHSPNSYVFTPKVDTLEKLSNNIMVVYQDKKNNYWFGSWQDGLYRYDGRTIAHFTTKSGLPHNRIDDIKEDKFGNIYVNTSKGISRYNGQRFVTLNEISSNDWQLNPDDLWFKSAGFDGYVSRFDGKNLYRLKIPKTQLGEDYISKHPNTSNPYAVYTIYKDSKGNIWFGTALLGACRYNGTSVDWISEDDVTELHDGPSNGVRSIIEDKNGDFWFNSAYRYKIYGNAPSKTFYKRETSIGNLDGKKEGDLHEYLSIAKDNNNDLWFVTYKSGVWRYDGTKITHFPVQVNEKDITLFSIYKDNYGILWLGTHENGVFKFNGSSFEKF